jgi:peptidyl-prolyl cis-trans isomerase D
MAAGERIAAGADFADEVQARGLSLDDIDLGDVSRADLGPAGDAVFALGEPGVTGVTPSSLGPAIFRVNAVLAAQETSFEAARAELEADQRAIAARKEIDGKVNMIEDSLAGGATIEDLAAEQAMRNGRFDYAPGADDNDPISASAIFQNAIAAAHEGDFPEALRLEDGSLVAFEVRGTIAPSPRPFDSVRDRVASAWHAEALAEALRARGETITAAVAAGTPIESFGTVQVIPDLPREGTIDGAPNMAMRDLFKMAEGEVKLVQDADYSVILRLDRIIAAASTGAEAEDLEAQIKSQIEQTLADDALTLWTNALSQDAGISIDQARIDAINAQMN